MYPLVTGEFPAQMASNVENACMSWCHYDKDMIIASWTGWQIHPLHPPPSLQAAGVGVGAGGVPLWVGMTSISPHRARLAGIAGLMACSVFVGLFTILNIFPLITCHCLKMANKIVWDIAAAWKVYFNAFIQCISNRDTAAMPWAMDLSSGEFKHLSDCDVGYHEHWCQYISKHTVFFKTVGHLYGCCRTPKPK